ncbi:MAG: hypothetical protein R2748_02825 [Bryobacterales bacterium]
MALPAGIERLAPVAVFTFEQHPDLPLRDYAAGRLGLLAPTYARSYLYVAYRWMDGAPMSAGRDRRRGPLLARAPGIGDRAA